MISGHAQYAKGYVAETSKDVPSPFIISNQEANISAVGNITGSKEWQDSGKKDAQEGINEMKVSPGILLMALRIGSEFSEDLTAGCQWTRWKG